jgi:hypothetical protein
MASFSLELVIAIEQIEPLDGGSFMFRIGLDILN